MPSLAAGFIVFATSAAVLVLEILAGRLLAPYVGDTLQTWTGIIGTILAGIALGSWYGGRLADRVDPRRLLGPTTIIGGVLALFAVPLITLFGAALGGGGIAAILILSFIGFFAPAAVLSAVTPMVVKIQLSSLDETGEVVGRLSALSTAGAIFGTFVTGFLLVAALPSRPIVLVLGIALVLGGLGLWWWLVPRDSQDRSPAPLAVVGLFAAGLTFAAAGPCEFESAYYCGRVDVDAERPSGRELRLDTLRHSYVDLEDPTYLEFEYTQRFADVIEGTFDDGAALSSLHIGGGGFSMPRYLEATRQGSTSTVFEIDPLLVRVAEQELGLEVGEDIEIRAIDARLGVADLDAQGYDLVIGDAFGGLAVPWHLTTLEFVEQLHERMAPDGVYTINVIDYQPMDFARAEAATLREVFAHVAAIAPRDRFTGSDRGGNVVLVASDAPIAQDGISAQLDARERKDALLSGEDLDEWIGGAQVLTDDFAPVDQLLTPPVR